MLRDVIPIATPTTPAAPSPIWSPLVPTHVPSSCLVTELSTLITPQLPPPARRPMHNLLHHLVKRLPPLPQQPCHPAAKSHAAHMHIPPYPRLRAADIDGNHCTTRGLGRASTRSCPRMYTPRQLGEQRSDVGIPSYTSYVAKNVYGALGASPGASRCIGACRGVLGCRCNT